MYRHRIHENFPEHILDGIVEIMDDPENTSNNIKVDKLLDLVSEIGFTEIGPGTNRLAVRNSDYVFKIAMDSYGVRDNWNEFNMSPILQPYVTKTYECNGLIAVAEYVNVIGKQEFEDSKENIRSILKVLAENFLFCDLSASLKNYMNFGFNDDDMLVVLDYGYIYPLDRRIMFCKKCGNKLKWNVNFDKLLCVACGKEHNPIEIRDRMWKAEDSFTDYDFEFEGDDIKGKKGKKKKKKDDAGMLVLDLSTYRED